jgi:ferrous iron transport protein B
MDEARRKGLEVDVRSLTRDLGVPAVPTVARTREGLHDLVRAVAGVVSGETRTRPLRRNRHPELQQAIDELVPAIEAAVPGIPNAPWIAWRLLDGDHRVRQALLSGELAQLARSQGAPLETRSSLVSLEGRQ